MDKQLLQKICELKDQGEPLALVTIVSTQGSTPRKAGAAMLVEATGRIWGTIGGGCGEAEVRQQALLAMDEKRSSLYQVNLLNDMAAAEGMVCGGVMEVFIQVI
ncbi:MAG: XdhC family protein [Negativicutes bacterium]|nr:XdhC family protein [Negativicutes bacterium]